MAENAKVCFAEKSVAKRLFSKEIGRARRDTSNNFQENREDSRGHCLSHHKPKSSGGQSGFTGLARGRFVALSHLGTWFLASHQSIPQLWLCFKQHLLLRLLLHTLLQNLPVAGLGGLYVEVILWVAEFKRHTDTKRVKTSTEISKTVSSSLGA